MKARFTLYVLIIVAGLTTVLSGCGPVTTQPQAPGAAPQTNPRAVVEAFYQWYTGRPGNPLADRAYRDSEYLIPAFIQKVDGLLDSFEGGAYDPFLCAQDVPAGIAAADAVVSGDQASVVVRKTYNPGTAYEVVYQHEVVLQMVGGQWKISDVLCDEAPPAAPEQTVEAFYSWYLGYARNTGNPLVDRAYRDSEYLTPAFAQKVDGLLDSFEGGGYDPFLCAQDIPEGLIVGSASGSADRADVTVRTSFEGHQFTATLRQVDGQWKIDDIVCAPAQPTAPSEPTGQPGGSVAFEGIAFSYDPGLACEVAAEVLPAEELMGGVGSLPEHIGFRFSGYALPDTFHEPMIRVYPVEAVEAGSQPGADVVAQLRQLLEERPAEPEAVPFLPLFNAGQMMRARIAYIDFRGGSGVRFLTEYAQYYAPINNYDLFYTFQGLTSDGKYYVSAILPVAHPDLPADMSALTAEELQALADDYDPYIQGMTAQLNSADPASFTPDLSLLDEMIGSIEAK